MASLLCARCTTHPWKRNERRGGGDGLANGGCRENPDLQHHAARTDAQSEDVSLTTADKLQIAERLDDLGIDYIEGGWPGSNARDAAFFS